MQTVTAETSPLRTGGPAAGLRGRGAALGRRFGWVVIAAADVGLLVWAAMAAFAPEHLLGPRSMPILPAGYEGFTGASWAALAAASSRAADYVTLLFRMYGLYGIAFCLMAIAVASTAFRRGERWAWWALLIGNTITFIGAMTYDQIVRAVGPFELSEYLGLAAVYLVLALTAKRPTGARNR